MTGLGLNRLGCTGTANEVGVRCGEEIRVLVSLVEGGGIFGTVFI